MYMNFNVTVLRRYVMERYASVLCNIILPFVKLASFSKMCYFLQIVKRFVMVNMFEALWERETFQDADVKFQVRLYLNFGVHALDFCFSFDFYLIDDNLQVPVRVTF